jgi:hypothetical protein
MEMRLAVMAGAVGLVLTGCGGGSAAAGYSCADVQAAQAKLRAASGAQTDAQAAVGLWNELETSLFMFHSAKGAIRAAANGSISASTSLAPDAGDVAAVNQALVAASKTCD